MRHALIAADDARMTHDTPWLVVGAGGASRDRTGDLLVANQTLSQLSYGPLRSDSLEPEGRAGAVQYTRCRPSF